MADKFLKTLDMGDGNKYRLLPPVTKLSTSTVTVPIFQKWDQIDYKFNNIKYSNGIWVATDENGNLYSSVDGRTWNLNAEAVGSFDSLYCFNIDDTPAWIATTNGGTFLYSYDGVDWATNGIPTGAIINRITLVSFNGGTYFFVFSTETGIYMFADGLEICAYNYFPDEIVFDCAFDQYTGTMVAATSTGIYTNSSQSGDLDFVNTSDVECHRIVFNESLGNVFFALCADVGVLLSKDDGFTWESIRIAGGEYFVKDLYDAFSILVVGEVLFYGDRLSHYSDVQKMLLPISDVNVEIGINSVFVMKDGTVVLGTNSGLIIGTGKIEESYAQVADVSTAISSMDYNSESGLFIACGNHGTYLSEETTKTIINPGDEGKILQVVNGEWMPGIKF